VVYNVGQKNKNNHMEGGLTLEAAWPLFASGDGVVRWSFAKLFFEGVVTRTLLRHLRRTFGGKRDVWVYLYVFAHGELRAGATSDLCGMLESREGGTLLCCMLDSAETRGRVLEDLRKAVVHSREDVKKSCRAALFLARERGLECYLNAMFVEPDSDACIFPC